MYYRKIGAIEGGGGDEHFNDMRELCAINVLDIYVLTDYCGGPGGKATEPGQFGVNCGEKTLSLHGMKAGSFQTLFSFPNIIWIKPIALPSWVV